MNYRAVLFDFDGVVANSLWFYRHTWEQFIAKSHLPLSSSVFEKEGFFTKSLEQVCQTLQEKYNIELDKQKLIDETLIIEQTLMAEGLECDPTLIPFLEYCKKQNIKIAIGSNSGTRRIMWVLEKIGIEAYFLHHPEYPERWYNIVSTNDITHHKPDPEVWIRCAEILEVQPNECLIIEDGLPGLTGAKQCGAQTAYYHRFRKPERACIELAEKSVESFSELFE
jgi:beta-phosphoglucomutase-like phosphatase (HAD superfamily)